MSTIPFLHSPDSIVGKKVEVYFNLHKHLFSVKDRATGKVIAHMDWIPLEDVTFHVSEAGRQRVLSEKRKNVHATVRGTVSTVAATDAPTYLVSTVSYNPYKAAHFTETRSGLPVAWAQAARLSVWTENGATKGKIFAIRARALDMSVAA